MDRVKKSKSYPKLADDDFYINEKGWLVFTKNYHLKRGYCCENACLHCPYGFKQQK